MIIRAACGGGAVDVNYRLIGAPFNSRFSPPTRPTATARPHIQDQSSDFPSRETLDGLNVSQAPSGGGGGPGEEDGHNCYADLVQKAVPKYNVLTCVI